jgi:hypothetical protein
MTQLAGADLSANVLFVTTGSGTNADQLATRINGQFASNGADATSFRALTSSALATRQQSCNFSEAS